MLAGNLASIGVGGIVTVVTSMIVSTFRYSYRTLPVNIEDSSGRRTSISSRRARSTHLPSRRARHPLTSLLRRRVRRSANPLTWMTTPCLPPRLRQRKRRSWILSRSTGLSGLLRGHPSSSYVTTSLSSHAISNETDFVLVIPIDFGNVDYHSSPALLRADSVWGGRTDGMGRHWHDLGVLLGHCGRPLPVI